MPYLVGCVNCGERALEAHHLLIASVCLERRVSPEQVVVAVLNCGQLVISDRELVRGITEDCALPGFEVEIATILAHKIEVAVATRLDVT
jgi:hypothetical protein